VFTFNGKNQGQWGAMRNILSSLLIFYLDLYSKDSLFKHLNITFGGKDALK